jgi:hypothetical protein
MAEKDKKETEKKREKKADIHGDPVATFFDEED